MKPTKTQTPPAPSGLTPAHERRIRDALVRAGQQHLAPHLFPAANGLTDQQAREMWDDPSYRGRFLAMVNGDLHHRVG